MQVCINCGQINQQLAHYCTRCGHAFHNFSPNSPVSGTSVASGNTCSPLKPVTLVPVNTSKTTDTPNSTTAHSSAPASPVSTPTRNSNLSRQLLGWFLLVVAFIIISAFLVLNSFNVLPGPIVTLAAETSALIALVVSLLSFSPVSQWISSNLKLRKKTLIIPMIVIIMLSELCFVVLPSWIFLTPLASPWCPPFPTFLASSQYITLVELYQKVTCRSPSLDISLDKPDKRWDMSSSCFFKNGHYEVVAQQQNSGLHGGGVQECFFHGPTYSNFAFQVNMNFLSGNTMGGGGLVFRSPDPRQATMYRVDQAISGSYNLYLGINKECNRQNVGPDYCDDTGIDIKGAKELNVLTVIVFGDRVYFYVNGNYVDEASSDISNSGYIGLFANYYQGVSDIAFSDLKVWELL